MRTSTVVIKSEKNRDGGMMLGYCLHGLCALPNMVINAKIMRKSGKNQEEKERHHV